MKLNYTLFVALFFLLLTVNAQDTEETPKGKVTGKVFFNYHLDLTEGAEQDGAFELNRSYLGYQYKINNKFTAKILLDAGKGSGGSDYTLFIKNAKLDYKASSNLTLTAGIFGLKQFKDQEKIWGYRYLYKALADEYKFGTSADLGVMAEIKASDKIKITVLIVNGEGFKRLQDQTGNNRYGINIVYEPIKNITLKAYVDTMKGLDIDTEEDVEKETTVTNYAFFAGYKTSKFRIGAEYNLMQNGVTFNKPSEDKDLQGLSFYATYNINEKWNVFGRFDELSSNTLSGETINWNFSKDVSTYIAGVEYRVIKGINTSLNVRYFDFKDTSINEETLVYLNLEFFF